MLKHAFWLILAATVALPARADPGGIRFDEMPVGCRIHGRYSTGERVVDVYMGKFGARHVMKTYEGPEGKRLIRTTTYSRDGLMQRKDWAGGKWETFSPAACLEVLGDCAYTYRNADGVTHKYLGTTTTKGQMLISRGGFVGQTPFPPLQMVQGRYNLTVLSIDGDLTFKVTRFEGCDEKLSS